MTKRSNEVKKSMAIFAVATIAGLGAHALSGGGDKSTNKQPNVPTYPQQKAPEHSDSNRRELPKSVIKAFKADAEAQKTADQANARGYLDDQRDMEFLHAMQKRELEAGEPTIDIDATVAEQGLPATVGQEMTRLLDDGYAQVEAQNFPTPAQVDAHAHKVGIVHASTEG